MEYTTFHTDLAALKDLAPTENSFIITDENVEMHHHDLLKPWKSIVLPAGESTKCWEQLDDIVRQLEALDADRHTTIIAVGGGVVCDIAAFAAGIFMRGVRCILVPTSILAMVDAALGGKNGINVGLSKNLVGLIRQPAHVYYYLPFLKTLPNEEWVNGFAEIIKHASITDASLFEFLQQHSLKDFRNDQPLLQQLIETNIEIKMNIVQQDEREAGLRKILNFGHTVGHAIEQRYALPHGQAVAIGMVAAAKVSEQLVKFKGKEELISLIAQYGLPTDGKYDMQQLLFQLKKDKKKHGEEIDFVLLTKIGESIIHRLTFEELEIQLTN